MEGLIGNISTKDVHHLCNWLDLSPKAWLLKRLFVSILKQETHQCTAFSFNVILANCRDGWLSSQKRNGQSWHWKRWRIVRSEICSKRFLLYVYKLCKFGIWPALSFITYLIRWCLVAAILSNFPWCPRRDKCNEESSSCICCSSWSAESFFASQR